MVPPDHCQPTLRDKLGMLRILARGRALRRLPRIWHWLRIWARHDPGFDHWHLGPAAVDRARQGQGVGSQLMAAICELLDRSEEHTSELQSLMRISYAVFRLKTKKHKKNNL